MQPKVGVEDIPQIKTKILSQEEFLTTKELMRHLKVRHRQTIYKLIQEGLPKINVGRSYRFIKAEVIAFLKEYSRSNGDLK